MLQSIWIVGNNDWGVDEEGVFVSSLLRIFSDGTHQSGWGSRGLIT